MLAQLVGVLALSGAAGFFLRDGRPERSKLGQFAAWSLFLSYVGITTIIGAVCRWDEPLLYGLSGSSDPARLRLPLALCLLVAMPIVVGGLMRLWTSSPSMVRRALVVGAGYTVMVAHLLLEARC